MHRKQRRRSRIDRGRKPEGIVYVFGTRNDTPPKAQVIRKQFRTAVVKAGLPDEWAPRETHHSFTSIMSDLDVPIETIADLLGHTSSTTTRTVYRHQLRPVITIGAEILDEAFGAGLLVPASPETERS